LTILTTETLTSSNSALPDDGDETEKHVGAVLMQILILLLKKLFCASVGK
jgi:hypothetical protein